MTDQKTRDPAETINAALSSWLAGSQLAGWHGELPSEQIVRALLAAGFVLLYNPHKIEPQS